MSSAVNTSPSSRRWLVAVLAAAILLLALVLRVRGLDTTGLWGDQAFTLNTAMRWVNGGDIPLAANKSSVGFLNPPMIEYLYAGALRLWPDILSVSWLTLLGGMLAVAVTGWVTGRIFGARAGLWAMLAFAVAPWAVFWSQLIWNQTMVPPFAALALGGLLLYIVERPRAIYLIIAFVAAAAMTQVHPGTAVQVLVMGLVLLLFRRRVRWSHVIMAGLVFAAMYLPYLLYQISTGWADVQAMGSVAGQEAAFSTAALRLSLDLIRVQGLLRSVPRTAFFDALATALFAISVVLVLWRGWTLWRNSRNESEGKQSTDSFSAMPAESAAVLIISLWYLFPLLFYWRSGVYLQNYYLIGQWPAQFMFFGIGLDTAQRLVESRARQTSEQSAQRLWQAAAWLLAIPFVAVLVFQIRFTLAYQDARAAGDGPALQVRHARSAITQANELLTAQPECRLVAVGTGSQVENSNLALLQEFTDPARILLTDGDLGLPLPTPCGIYLNARSGSPAAYWLEGSATPVPGAAVEVKDQVWPFYTWTADPPADVSGAPTWENGVALIGYFRGQPQRGTPWTWP
ncbi:MAG: glycosyltransferase family 39 protein [Chloroflexota bacterium]